MALINCSNCGKQISDKATNCIHCGCVIEKKIICSECGSQIYSKSNVCNYCGCPVNQIKSSSNTNELITNVMTENTQSNFNDSHLEENNQKLNDTNNIKKKTKLYIIGISSFFLLLFILFIIFIFADYEKKSSIRPIGNNSTNNNSNDYYSEDITLTKNEQKVYNTLVNHILRRAHNPQAVRVVSGNTLFGYKISGTNKVGGTITNCISLMPANYLEEDTCSSVYDDQWEDSEWYIDVYKINKKLEEYWNNKGI